MCVRARVCARTSSFPLALINLSSPVIPPPPPSPLQWMDPPCAPAMLWRVLLPGPFAGVVRGQLSVSEECN